MLVPDGVQGKRGDQTARAVTVVLSISTAGLSSLVRSPLPCALADGIIAPMTTRWVCLLLLLCCLVACALDTAGRTVTLVADGETREITTEAATVRDLLLEADITLGAEDWVAPPEPTVVGEGMVIRVTRVETRTKVERRQLPFDRRMVRDPSIPRGDAHLLEPGRIGWEELTYQTTSKDGVEVDRRLVRQVTVEEPRTEIILTGAWRDEKPVAITGTVAYVASGNAWVIRATSVNQRRLTNEGDLDGRVFALSADGSHLLFTRAPTETEHDRALNTIWVVNTALAAAEPVRLEVGSVLWAGWEPNCTVEPAGSGCRIAFSTGSKAPGNPGWQANNDLWIARLRPKTGELVAKRRILEPSGGGSYGWWPTTYAWSPDGQSLAYGRPDGVGVVRADSGQDLFLARFAPYRTYGPWVWTPSVDWSPQGEFIVTTLHGPALSGEPAEDSPVFDLWVLAVDGSISAKLSREAGMWSAPSYAPGTELIAFARARNPYASHTSSYDLYVMDRDGSDRQLIFPAADEPGLTNPARAWDPAGETLSVVYQENLYLVGVSDGHCHQLTDQGGVTAVQWH